MALTDYDENRDKALDALAPWLRRPQSGAIPLVRPGAGTEAAIPPNAIPEAPRIATTQTGRPVTHFGNLTKPQHDPGESLPVSPSVNSIIPNVTGGSLTDEERRQLSTQASAPTIPALHSIPPLPATQQANLAAGTKLQPGVGREMFGAGIPPINAAPGTADYGAQRQERLDYEKLHPWGSEVSEHPGTWGKIAHVASRVGNIAGDVFAPATMANIPGTDLNKQRQEAQNERWINLGGENQLREAEEQGIRQRPEIEAQKEKAAEARWEAAEEGREKRLGETTAAQDKRQQATLEANERRTQEQIDAANERQERALTRHSNPFEAFAYGDPNERKAAQDFIALEGRQKLQDRPPSEVEQRYRLFQKDPDAYRAMFGDREAGQTSRDQAQAARMLNYFEKQRKTIRDDFTLDDAEKQRQLSEIDDMEKPYLDVAQPGGHPRAANAGGPRPSYKAGDEVTYKGQHMRVRNIRPDGKLELEPVGGGTQ